MVTIQKFTKKSRLRLKWPNLIYIETVQWVVWEGESEATGSAHEKSDSVVGFSQENSEYILTL